MRLRYIDKPINDFQSLSGKPVNEDAKAEQYFPIKMLCHKYNSDGKACQGKFYEHTDAKHMQSIWGCISGHPAPDVVK